MKFSARLTLAIIIALAPAALADCPDCYRDQQPLDPAKGLSADGRVRIVVGIAVGPGGATWGNPPGTNIADQTIATAAGNGMGMWNNATDNHGGKIPYFFDTISGTQPTSSVDIVVVKRPQFNTAGRENPEAEMETGGGRPFRLFVREDVPARMSASDLAGLFAHELGHRIGLSK